MIRLSSLGDVILATAGLDANAPVDWVVSREYGDLLEGHPGISRLWTFDRRTGFKGWLRLCRDLWAQDYQEIVDLHRTLRSTLLVAAFRLWGVPRLRWTRVSRVGKPRLRLWGYFLFKGLWPRAWKPGAWVGRFSRMLRGDEKGRPNLTHLTVPGMLPAEIGRLPVKAFICVMPGSLWLGKRWSTEGFLEALAPLSCPIVVLGGPSDRESFALAEALRKAGKNVVSGAGVWSLREVAAVLARSAGCLGNDTGLAHLAEAVGVSAWTVFGPTVPDMGFGPWRPGSRTFAANLWCQPCGKDGRACFRPVRRYECLRVLSAEQVGQGVKSCLEAPRAPS